MTRIIIVLLTLTFSFSGILAAQELNSASSSKGIEPIQIISSKKVILSLGNIQRIKTGENGESILNIEFFQMDLEEFFPIIKIQGIPFKLTQQNENLEFAWQNSNYTLLWLEDSEKVSLVSSEPFGERTFSSQAKQVKSELIHKGLSVETKRLTGETARLDVTGIKKDSKGGIWKFSVRTYSNTRNMKNYQNENNLIVPKEEQKIEKGVNGEVLFIFGTDDEGEVYVYYR